MRICVGVMWACLFAAPSHADDPCKSGPQPGRKPGPYSFIMATGDKRGAAHCYICETGDHPAVAVFARNPSAALGKLAHQLDRALTDHKADHLRAWITFLSADQPSLDPKLVKWGLEHGIRQVPLGVFEDAVGPPSYRLARDADVTVLFFVKQQVVANFAFRDGELNEKRIDEMLKSLPDILPGKR